MVSRMSISNVSSHGCCSASHHRCKQLFSRLYNNAWWGWQWNIAPIHMQGVKANHLKATYSAYTGSRPGCRDTRLILKGCHTESISTNKDWYCVILNSWVMQYCSSICIHCNAIFLYDLGFKTFASFCDVKTPATKSFKCTFS